MALTKKEIETFKNQLLMLQAKLQKSVSTVTKDVKTDESSKGYSQHQADEGTDDFGRTISLEVSGKESDVLRQIERALEKIDEGTYGVCDVSEEPIPKKRLEAIPYASMTVAAQEQVEKGLL